MYFLRNTPRISGYHADLRNTGEKPLSIACHLLPSKLLSNIHGAWTSTQFALSNSVLGSSASPLCNNKPFISWRYKNGKITGRSSVDGDLVRSLSWKSHSFERPPLSLPPTQTPFPFSSFLICNLAGVLKMSSLRRARKSAGNGVQQKARGNQGLGCCFCTGSKLLHKHLWWNLINNCSQVKGGVAGCWLVSRILNKGRKTPASPEENKMSMPCRSGLLTSSSSQVSYPARE